MSLRIEDGKFYRTANGQKVGPMRFEGREHFDGDEHGGSSRCYFGDGRRFDRMDATNDLVAEWSDGPVRTVTRKEIVPGVYGRVRVGGCDNEWLPVCIDIAGAFNAAELRAAAATLTEIADALGEAS